MENNKTPDTDGLPPEFYRYFWNLLGSLMVSSFNYAFRNGTLSISQRQGIISLIPKKKNELLAQRIRRSKEIKGIPIDEHIEVKLSQYADDTTVLLSDAQSLKSVKVV